MELRNPYQNIRPLRRHRGPSISAERTPRGSIRDACSETEIHKRVMGRQRGNVMRAMMPTRRAPFSGDKFYRDLARERKLCGK